MTEEEAKTKWCPFARFKFAATSECPSSNREGGPSENSNPWLHQGTRCIGSACMAWRLIPAPAEESLIEGIRRYRIETGAELQQAKDYVEAHPEYRRKSDMPSRGFCGLAGRPE